ncbi:cytochrome P450 [Deinococcus apachensis]|uniref:cytochrome P450 n=1 Tax=Deinococcus apachensis TaxID=309886 RepID=UPI00036180C2|nr:cytochrome P450 [Deinococcus apachensis]
MPQTTAPAALPVLGHTPAFARDPLGFLQRLKATQGPVARFSLGAPFVLLTRPADVHTVLQDTGRTFSKGYQRGFAMPLVLGNGLVSSEGDFWRRQRRLAQPAFHATHIARYGETMVRLTQDLMRTWQEGEVRDLQVDMTRLTQRIVVATLFGTTLPEDEHRLSEALSVIEDGIMLDNFTWRALVPPFLPAPGRPALRRAVATVEQVLERVMAERRESGETHSDLLGLLMGARDDEGNAMTDRQLRDEAVTLYIAGHETTANTLAWALWLLSQHDEARERLEEELRVVLGSRAPTTADLPRLPYLNAAVKETLRLYPAAWIFNRRVDTDVTLGGETLKAGTSVMVSPWLMHREGQVFGDPLAFRPERWEDGFERQLPRGAYLPFGGGPRICIGNAFASMEAALVLATLLQEWRVKAPGRVTPLPSITLRPKGGLPSRLQRRGTG